jgi:hypothetical protein
MFVNYVGKSFITLGPDGYCGVFVVTNDPVGQISAVLNAERLDPCDVRGGSLAASHDFLVPLVLALEVVEMLRGTRTSQELGQKRNNTK